MGWTDWFYGPGKSVKGPTPNRTEQTPSPEPIAYRQRENGLLGWLRDSLSGWLGPQHSPGTPVESEVLGERVRSGPRGIILPWFAPYMDEYTRETSGMRLAYRWMWADPNVKAAVLGKILSVCALDLNVIPAGKKKRPGFQGSGSQGSGPRAREDNFRNEEIAEFVRWNLTERVQGCVPELAWSILSGGLTDGYSVSEKVWHHESRDEYAGKYVLFALKAKDVGNDVVLETDEFRNIVGVRALRYSAGEVFSPSSFVIFRHLPLFGTPVGMSDFRAAYGRWWMLDTVLKLRAMGLEKRAMPVMLGEYETTAQKPSLESALSLVRSQTWLSVPKGVRVEALNIAGSADSMFASAVADLKEDIFLAIQGATLQALTGQEGAMRGNSKVHKSTSDLFRWYLARCLEVILNDRDNGLIRDMVDLNYVVSSYPRAVLGAIDTADLLQEAELDQRLLSMGLKLSKSELYEKYSRTPPGDPDDEMQPPGQGGPGKPPGGPGGPGGASGGGPGGLAGLLGGGGPDKSPDDQQGDLPGKEGGQSADQSPDLFAESEWEESKHPRGKGGKFAGKGGGSSGGSPGGDKGEDKGAVKKDRTSHSPDAPAGKGEQSGDPGLPAGRGAGGVKLDEDIDWSEVTQQEAAEKLRKQATDPDRRKKERKEVIKKLSSIGSAVKWLGKAAYAKLTIVEREIFDAGYGAVKWIEHALESFKRTTQQLATTVAQERGFPPDRVERVAHAVAAADASLAWTINIPLAHQYLHEAHHIDGWAGFGLAKIGYFLPTASLAYCAYSTARNPLAMARAAWKVLTGRGAKMPSKHAEDGEPLMGQELMDALMERLDAIDEEHGTPGVDWWYALFAGALDQTRDARKALELADAAFADHPEPPDLKEITGEEIADWLDNYDGSKVGAAKNCEGCGGNCGGGCGGGGASQEVSNFTRRQDHAENGPNGFESFLEERKDKSGKRYCVEPGKGRVPCPPTSSSAGSGEKQKKATPAQDTPRKAGKEADKSTPDSGGGDHLDKLGMGDLRKVGEKAGVKGRSKAELADKIRSVMQGSPASREEIQSILNGMLQAGPGAGGGASGKSSKVAVKATKDAADGVERAKSLAAKHREGSLTQGDLAGLGMGDLRALGVLVGVKGRSKDDLQNKILQSQGKTNQESQQKQPDAPRKQQPAKQDAASKKKPASRSQQNIPALSSNIFHTMDESILDGQDLDEKQVGSLMSLLSMQFAMTPPDHWTRRVYPAGRPVIGGETSKEDVVNFIREMKARKAFHDDPDVASNNPDIVLAAIVRHIPSLKPLVDKDGRGINFVLSDPHAVGSKSLGHLWDLGRLPVSIHQEMANSEVSVYATNSSVPNMNSNQDLAGVSPRGWGNATWDDVAGAYNERKKQVLAGSGHAGSYSLALHEYGHAIGRNLRHNGETADVSRDWMKIHASVYEDLEPYYQQGGPGGYAGAQELFAELVAIYHIRGKKYAERWTSPEAVAYLEKIIEKAGK